MWIRTIEPTDADNDLRAVYERVLSSRGKLSDIMRVQSLAPKAMAAHLDLYLALMFGRSTVSRDEREAIAVAVSATNGCAYCVAHHEAALQAHWRDADRVRRFTADPDSADLSGRLRAMVRYAVKLTRDVHGMEESDLLGMREAGVSDEEILQVNMITAYFNFVNRLAEGLGVSPSPDEVAGYAY